MAGFQGDRNNSQPPDCPANEGEYLESKSESLTQGGSATGIKDRYTKEELTGKVVVAVVNLEPKSVAGVVSECTLLAAFNDADLGKTAVGDAIGGIRLSCQSKCEIR
jgi:Putative tRNA binding domain